MKIKVYVVDVRLPRWLHRTIMFGVVPSVVLGLCALVYAAAVNGQPDFVDGETLTASALNAHLGALQAQIQPPPPKSVVLTTLSAADLADTTKFSAVGLGTGAYLGWAVCNGNNGTANLTGRFPRMLTSGAGAIGGSDSHAHTMANHTHAARGSMYAAISTNTNGAGLIFQKGALTDTFVSTHKFTVTAEDENFVQTNGLGVPLYGTTAAPSSNTTDSGDGRPAFYEFVPLCKL